ncbi:hypothetical protein QYM36_012486, partial [Artemia franciscana]
YRDLPYASHPVAHCEEIPVPVFTEFPDSKDKATSGDEGRYTEEEHKAQDDL